MKTLLVGIALAVAMTFATQAFALPSCQKHSHHYVCTDYEQ